MADSNKTEKTPKQDQNADSLAEVKAEETSDKSAAPTDPNDRRICFCHNVMKSVIETAIKDGAHTIEAIQAETCASTGCGGCEIEVEEILEEELGKLGKKKTA